MAKLVSIGLSALILFQSLNIPFHALLELDELIEHAQFHSETHGDNFWVFFSKHYGDLKEEHSKEHKEEQEDHEQLPFQHQNCHAHTIFFVFCPMALPRIGHPVEKADKNLFVYTAPCSNFEQDTPLQPPRYL
ncbi:MAG: hypothetical protein AB3N16_13975 [Flavobacteriaceae bacterium]